MPTPEDTQIIGAICAGIQAETNRLVEWTEKASGGYRIRIFESLGYTRQLSPYIEFTVTPAMLSSVYDVSSLRFLVEEILLATRLKGDSVNPDTAGVNATGAATSETSTKKRQKKTKMEKRWSGKWNV